MTSTKLLLTTVAYPPSSGPAPHKTREASGSRKVYGFQTKGDLACKKSFKDQIKFCFVHKIQNPFS